MNEAQANLLVEQLALMKFFPGDAGARFALVRLLMRMCGAYEQGQWLVDRCMDLFSEWPGPHELRAVYCSKFRPEDGVNAYSQKFVDGIPSEKERKKLSAPTPAALIEGPKAEPAIEDPKAAAAIHQLANAMPKMPSGEPVGGKFEKYLREVITAPGDTSRKWRKVGEA